MKSKIRKTCVLLFVISATAGNIAGVAAQAVTYGANETSKTLAVSRSQLTTPSLFVRATSEPMARVCAVPDGVAAVRSFVAYISSRPAQLQQQEARNLLGALKGFESTDSGENRSTTPIRVETWMPLGFPGAGEPLWFDAERNSRLVRVSEANIAALNSGQSVSQAIVSRCLTVPAFKAWLGEVVRVLEQYYQTAN